ncbi:hypothetical protein BDY19DRAFT_916485 [Irpex rosettiformis]|uniref:Uncharacterized protein n=1 Tax=Irpex rosettiformis TaxID=378272 RepID=A0ACB8ULZ3_9APHY|nr:hypothetical protein BDY19DRAFT_916485 [Irpex rosettiformis]
MMTIANASVATIYRSFDSTHLVLSDLVASWLAKADDTLQLCHSYLEKLVENMTDVISHMSGNKIMLNILLCSATFITLVVSTVVSGVRT